MESIFDVIYPTGSIYMSMSNVSPEILFGGKWAPLNGVFLLATDVDQQAWERGGEREHVLTDAELAIHSHQCGVEGKTVGLVVTSADGVNIGPGAASVVQLKLDNEYYHTASRLSADTNNVVTTEVLTSDKNNSTKYAPQNQPHNNMPPYITVYMWHRVV